MPSRPDPSIGRPVPDRAGAHAERPGLDAILTSYAAPAGHFDDLMDGAGVVRPHWRGFAGHTPGLSADALGAVETAAARQLHEDGVTYNVYADAGGPARPWALDVLPNVVPAVQWEPIARGLRQRARLLNALAADLYGPQRTLEEGLIPPALVHGHPGFLRACHGVAVPGGVYLHQVAFDLARGPDGRWWVAGTRTQSPSGAGYALENRLTVSRLFPDAFRELRVQRLAQFFLALQQALREGAPCDGEAPRIVLLTPGSYTETYFEHAYLARYLGFTLVEGGDLAVREDRVYLKTLTGLERVHAILRRLDDDFCDPLELRPDSALGVPGLVQAWRAGHVLVANAFGLAVLESAALSEFLPAAAERLLGMPLELPCIPTWWCGDEAALDEARRRLPEMVIKPAFPDARMEPVFAGDLDEAGRARWIRHLAEAPGRYVLQEYLPLSHAPVWHGGQMESRALMLRAFLVADGRGDYRVMPGGLSRIAGEDRHMVSSQLGGSSKDTWVLSESPIEPLSLLPGQLKPEDIAISQRAVSSRAGENLFWLGRYTERSENSARLLRAVLSRLPEESASTSELSPAVIRTCHRHGLLRAPGETYNGAPHRLEPDLITDMLDRKAGFSLAWNLEQTARVAGAVRDRLSTDSVRLVTEVFEAFAQAKPADGLAGALALIDRAIVSLAAAVGIEMERMTRDDGWRFLSLGRYIERLFFVATTVGEVTTSGEDAAELQWLLELSDSAMTYRARYVRPPEWLAAADLLLCDRRHPRSAAFQLAKLAKQVRLLPSADLEELIAEIGEAQAMCHIAEPATGGLLLRPGALEDFLRRCERLALRLSDALTLRYFSHIYETAQATATL